MKLFVLTGVIDYGGDTVMGVYSSVAIAQAALHTYKSAPEMMWRYDDYRITETVLDAAALNQESSVYL